jgi:hypothetical protein
MHFCAVINTPAFLLFLSGDDARRCSENAQPNPRFWEVMQMIPIAEWLIIGACVFRALAHVFRINTYNSLRTPS